MMDKERLKDLLFSYLNDTLDQEEYDELLRYINDDTYTEVLYESMDQEWQRLKIKSLLTAADQELVYHKVLADPRFAAPHLNRSVKKFSWFNRRTISAAAAIIAIVALGVYVSKIYPGWEGNHYANDVTPGTSKAILTLADGRKITLDASKKGKLAEQSGISISKTAEGRLVYTVSDSPSDNKDDIKTYNTLETPKGGEYQVNLPDGTKVWLNAASTLKYPTSFAAARERRVILEGEAYFEVAHDQHSPFLVVTGKQVLKVLGTHFNVNAYGNEPDTKTTLLEGSVGIKQLQGEKDLVLKPGQQAQVGKEVEVVDVDTETAVAWKNGDFVLKDEDFKTTMRKIARWYDVEVVYDESAPDDLELGGWVSRKKNISAVLKVMESTGKVHFKVQGRRIAVIK
ncbi:FecR family protein [Pedobacter sp. AW31-3R]|uniref:FecR family protein n=1 Tax=Pedobacter sp. AW31-3R TaxID=3445781 RepID=UPI003FA03E44